MEHEDEISESCHDNTPSAKGSMAVVGNWDTSP